MFYNETKTMELVSEDPSLVFELIKEGHIEFVDMLLKKKIVDINTCDEAGNNILVRLLKCGAYDVVLHHMGNKEWDVNHQNLDGNTFAHVLVSINYVNVVDIISKLKKNKEFFSRTTSICLNIVLAILVIVMFVISTTGSRPTILNYEKALQNRYASWEQELNDRENAVREKERQLMLDED